MRFRHIARNVFSNWFATGANMAVGFFLAPFLVHRLGNAEYGVWVLAISLVNYLGLLDLGMRSAVLRFVSKGHTVGDHASAGEALSAALWVRLQISVLVLLLSAGLAAAFPVMFKVQPALAANARIAVMIIGTTTALGMSLGVFGGVLSALNRYDLQSVVTLVQLTVRVSGVVWVLRTGHGIVAIALCELTSAVVGNVLLVWIARRIYPQLKLQWTRPKASMLHSLWMYSFYAFLTTIAVQLVYQTDNLIVGTFISASAVTFYSIGNSLCRYTDQFASSMAATFVPAASNYEASGHTDGLRSLYTNGTRVTLGLALPILVTLITRGHTFISLWMGPSYAHEAGNVLVMLAVPLLFAYANRTAVSIAFGVGKHKKSAIWAIWEGVANLVLSVTLVHWFGIYGVAMGTMIPNLFVQLVIWPRYVHELVGIKTSTVLRDVWGPLYLAAIPFGLVSYTVNKYVPTHSIILFVLQTVAILPVFVGVIALMFRDSITTYVVPRVRSFMGARTRET
nr:oligosaccharide flippase family protein [Granulicella sp. dw_53]